MKEYPTTGKAPQTGSVCAFQGCPEEHVHPKLGTPPDYHWLGNGYPEPRWRKVPAGRLAIQDAADVWYSVTEIAAAWGVSPFTVRAACRTGRLPASRPPAARGYGLGPYRIKGADFVAFLRNQGKAAA